MKMGHTVDLLKHRAREVLDDLSAQLVSCFAPRACVRDWLKARAMNSDV
jgi:predicted kinase